MLKIDGTKLSATVDGKPAIDYTLGTESTGRNGAAPQSRSLPREWSVLRPPVAGRIGLWAKTDTTSRFKDYIVSQAGK